MEKIEVRFPNGKREMGILPGGLLYNDNLYILSFRDNYHNEGIFKDHLVMGGRMYTYEVIKKGSPGYQETLEKECPEPGYNKSRVYVNEHLIGEIPTQKIGYFTRKIRSAMSKEGSPLYQRIGSLRFYDREGKELAYLYRGGKEGLEVSTREYLGILIESYEN